MRNSLFKVERVVLFVFLFCCSMLIFSLFLLYPSKFPSDWWAHYNHALNGEWYSINALLIILLNSINPQPLLYAFIMSFLLCVESLITYKLMIWLYDNVGGKVDLHCKAVFYACSFGLPFLCAIRIPRIQDKYYVDSFVTQPWHNSTSILMRLFGLITIWLFLRIIAKVYAGLHERLLVLLLFVVVFSLTNFAKPNFFIGFAPAVFLLLLCDFAKSRAKSFVRDVEIGMLIIGSMPIMIWQASVLFSDESKVAFTLRNLQQYFDLRWGVLSILTQMIFPIYVGVVVLFVKKQTDLNFRLRFLLAFSWLLWMISFLEKLCLIEVGERELHGNFGWGCRFFSYFLFMISYCVCYFLGEKGIINKKARIIGDILVSVHFFCGIIYYFKIILYGEYFI